MALRTLEIITNESVEEILKKSLEDEDILEYWVSSSDNNKNYSSKALLESDKVETLVDKLEEKFSDKDSYKAILYEAEAVFPRKDDKDKDDKDDENDKKDDKDEKSRLSIEELYNDIKSSFKLDKNYFIQVILSVVVAAIGLIQNNTAIIIGAMVIAPLLGPNISMAFGSTLGDISLIKYSLKSNLYGMLIALVTAIIFGYFLSFDPQAKQIIIRTSPDYQGILLSLAAGGAGALAFTSGVSAALVGVMVAVALLPPIVVIGLLIGSSEWLLAYGAFVVLMTNLISINISAIFTFLIQGVKPKNWYEKKKAKKYTYTAFTIWFTLLIVLLFMIFYYN